MSISKEYLMESYKGNSEKAIMLYDKANRVKRKWEVEFTDFLEPGEQKLLTEICNTFDLYVNFYGVKGDFERAMAAISPTSFLDDFPAVYLKISGNLKFEKLDHRDYLGSLLSLGIKRDIISDVNVFEDGAEFLVHKEISDYIRFNLKKIKHTGIKVEVISWEEARTRIQNFKEMSLITSSMRMDNVVSAIANISRAQSQNAIKRGEVKVNFVVEEEASKKLKEGDIISIKGHGRFKFEKITGTTKKERLSLLVYKYI